MSGSPDERNVAETSAARRRAAEAGHVGDADGARSLLDHDDATVRAHALRALHRLGALSAGELARCLADGEPEVRRAALAVAVAYDVDLVPLLGDRDVSVVEQAAWALGEREDAGAVDALLGVTTHPDALVREAAVAALGAIQDERGLEAILRAVEDKPAVRRRAVLALAAFEGPAVDDALARAAEDRDWQVRDAAGVVLDARGED